MFALFRLRDKGLLSGGEYARLAAAYQFLRYIEHRLQIEEDRQTHTLPSDPMQLDLLARKMPPESTGAVLTGETLKAEAGRAPGGCAGDLRPRDPRAEAHVLHHPARARGRRKRKGRRRRRRATWRAFWTSARRNWRRRWPAPACTAAASGSSTSWRRAFAGADLLEPPGRRPQAGRRRARYLRAQPLLCGRPAALPGAAGRDRAAASTGRRTAGRRPSRCGASTAGRCCASRARAFSQAAPIFATLGKTSALADRVIAAAYRIALTEAPPPAERFLHARATR